MALPSYCPDCGSAVVRSAHSIGHCSACRREVYANSKPTAGAIIERGGELCLVRRALDPGKGKLDFPGGYLDEGEYPEDGCRREIREELGIEIGELRPAFIELNDLGELVAFDVMYEAVAPDDQTMQPASDVAAIEWYPFDAVPIDDLAFDSSRRILERWRATRAPRELALLGGETVALDAAAASFAGPLDALPDGWRGECGEWSIHDGVVCGRVDGEAPAVLWHDQDVAGDHAVEVLAWTVPPHGNDINCFWEGSGRILGDGDVACSIAGFGGWWNGLSGIERYPEGGLRATGRVVELVAGRAHRLVAGRRGSADFLFVDGQLVMQLDDPAATRRARSRVALATWNSHVHFGRVAVHGL